MCLVTLLLPKTIQMLLPAQEDVFADDGGGGVDGVFQDVGCEDFVFVGMANDNRRAVARGDVDAAGSPDGGSVSLGNFGHALGAEDYFAGRGLETGQDAVVRLGEVKAVVV